MKFTGTIPSLTTPAIVVPEFDNGHWEFPEQMGGKPYVGFLYAIYDSVLQRAYLGKKLFEGHGKLNKGKESNWKKYASSSDLLKSLLKARPREEFEFICLEQYRMKGALSYAETWTLCLVEAPTTKLWYNTRIEAVSWVVSEAITDRHKQRIQSVVMRMRA